MSTSGRPGEEAMPTAAIYARKSNDQGDRDADVKSVQTQIDVCTGFIEKQGWQVGHVFKDDGITGATFKGRPGLQELLATLEPAANFTRLVVVDQSRIGREALDTMLVIRRLERAGVQVWSSRTGKQITMVGMEALLPMIESKMNEQQRRETAPKVREAAHTRHQRGYVVGGKTYGYLNK